MPTTNIEAPVLNHKVQVDAANNLCTRFVTDRSTNARFLDVGPVGY
jgi:hypothetical protein